MAIWGGKYGYVAVEIGGVPTRVKFAEWTLSIDGDDPETTNFESAGFYEDVEGIHNGTLTLNGPWDVGTMPITRGLQYIFHLGVGTGVEIPVPARVKTIAPSQKVRGKSEVSVTAKTNGTFTPSIT